MKAFPDTPASKGWEAPVAWQGVFLNIVVPFLFIVIIIFYF